MPSAPLSSGPERRSGIPMKLDVQGAPHIPAPRSVQSMMLDVHLALLPGIAAHVFFFGPGILVQIVLACAFAFGLEAIMLRLRQRPLRPFLTDFSAPLTAILYVLCLPPTMPWWTSLTGMFFAIVVAKHLYGGLGFNLFNPAMVGYAVVLICFPVQATSWLPPAGLETVELSFGQILHWIGFGAPPAPVVWDAVTGATPLDAVRTGATQGVMITEIRQQPIFGDFGGRGWEWIAEFLCSGGTLPALSAHDQLARSHWCARYGDRDVTTRLCHGCLRKPLPPGACIHRRYHARRLFHRDRSSIRGHDAQGPSSFRYRRRCSHTGNPPLGWVPGRRGLCGITDESDGTATRPIYPTPGLRQVAGRPVHFGGEPYPVF